MALDANDNDKRVNQYDTEQQKKINRQNKKLGYILLYAVVLIVIILGEIFLFRSDPDASLKDLLKDTVGNLMGVLAAFLVFDKPWSFMRTTRKRTASTVSSSPS